jgi:hypothetical protein
MKDKAIVSLVSMNEGLLDGRNMSSFQDDRFWTRMMVSKDINEGQLSLQEMSPLQPMKENTISTSSINKRRLAWCTGENLCKKVAFIADKLGVWYQQMKANYLYEKWPSLLRKAGSN